MLALPALNGGPLVIFIKATRRPSRRRPHRGGRGDYSAMLSMYSDKGTKTCVMPEPPNGEKEERNG